MITDVKTISIMMIIKEKSLTLILPIGKKKISFGLMLFIRTEIFCNDIFNSIQS